MYILFQYIKLEQKKKIIAMSLFFYLNQRKYFLYGVLNTIEETSI